MSKRLQCAVILLGLPYAAVHAAEGSLGKSAPVEIRAAKKLLFLPFYNEATDQNLAWLESSIGHSMHEIASKSFRYEKVDDNDFTMYFINKGYQVSDLYDFEKITKIAHDLGVDGVIYGRFKADEERVNVIVTGKILSVIDREVIAERTESMPISAEMFSGVEELSKTLGANIGNLFYPSDRGALVRAATLPGWGHRYKQRPGWGYFWGGAFWSAAAFTALSIFEFINYKIKYANYTPEVYVSPNGGVGYRNPAGAQAQFDTYSNNITTWSRFSLIGLASVALIYGANILHAYSISPDVVTNPDLTGEQKTVSLKLDIINSRTESTYLLAINRRF